MSKVTKKLQVSIPRSLADRYGIRAGDDLEWEPAGKTSAFDSQQRPSIDSISAIVCASLTRPPTVKRDDRRYAAFKSNRIAVGRAKASIPLMTGLVDTNVLVYGFDARFPVKQRVATNLLRVSKNTQSVRTPFANVMSSNGVKAVKLFIVNVIARLQGYGWCAKLIPSRLGTPLALPPRSGDRRGTRIPGTQARAPLPRLPPRAEGCPRSEGGGS
jgi:hypothetical protein